MHIKALTQLVIHNMKTFYWSFRNFKEDYFPKDIFQIIIEKTLHFLIRSGIYSGAVSNQVNKIFLPKTTCIYKDRSFSHCQEVV